MTVYYFSQTILQIFIPAQNINRYINLLYQKLFYILYI